jgi:hypothetical protein
MKQAPSGIETVPFPFLVVWEFMLGFVEFRDLLSDPRPLALPLNWLLPRGCPLPRPLDISVRG